MPTGLYTRWEYGSETKRFQARPNKSRSFENMVLSYFQWSRQDCKIESNVTTGRQKKIDCSSADGISYHCNTVFEAMGCYYHYYPCQEARPSLPDTHIERGVTKRQQDEVRRDYIQQKDNQIVEMLDCEWWSLYKTDTSVTSHLRENFPYNGSLSEEGLMRGIIDWRLFGYVQCDVEVPEHLRDYFSNFPLIFKNTVVSRDVIGNLMKQYAEKENIMVQTRWMLMSSFILTNGTIISPLLLFYLQLGLVCKKVHRTVQYTPRNCFDNFVQFAVDARGQRDENPNSSVVAETLKLLANSSYGCQTMDRRRHTVTKYLTDEKTHNAFISKMFKPLNHITYPLYEVELVKSENEHSEPILVVFFILQYAKLRMLELYCNFFVDSVKRKILWFWQIRRTWNGYRLPLLSHVRRKFGRCFCSRKTSWMGPVTFYRLHWELYCESYRHFFPRTCFNAHKKHDKRESGLFKEEFRCAKMLCLCSKTYCSYDKQTNKYKFSSKGLNKRTLEDSGDSGPMSKYRKVLEESVNVTSTNRRFRTNQHNVATYEQTMKGLSYFYSKRILEENEIHTKPKHL